VVADNCNRHGSDLAASRTQDSFQRACSLAIGFDLRPNQSSYAVHLSNHNSFKHDAERAQGRGSRPGGDSNPSSGVRQDPLPLFGGLLSECPFSRNPYPLVSCVVQKVLQVPNAKEHVFYLDTALREL